VRRLAAAGKHARDPVQKRPVLKVRKPLLLRAGPAIGVVAGIGLGKKYAPAAVDSKAVEKRAEAFDRFKEPIGGGIEHEQIAIGNVGVLDDVDERP
jgi:hypothetical protein